MAIVHPHFFLLATLFPLIASSFAPLPPQTRVLRWHEAGFVTASSTSSSSNDHAPLLQAKQRRGVDEGTIRFNPVYAALATAETIYWYWLAPGIDPSSRWFAPADAALIADKLLNAHLVLSPPPGSGIGPSSLLLNSFLILPAVWSLLLLQEDGGCTPGKTQVVSPLPFCAAGFLVGGGALIPYMIVRRSRASPGDVDPSLFPAALRLFEGSVGPAAFVALAAVVLATFVSPFVLGGSDWGVEWAAFIDRVQTSQFTSLAIFDFSMISAAILDPMADDAKRRGWLAEDASVTEAAARLAPYLVPLVGPVAWIYFRPKYFVD